jgi:hypothetical protein
VATLACLEALLAGREGLAARRTASDINGARNAPSSINVFLIFARLREFYGDRANDRFESVARPLIFGSQRTQRSVSE